LPFTSSFPDVLCFRRPCPPTIGFATTATAYINERETPKTYLTNHKGYISYHITPLVINSLRGGHTHTLHGQKQFQDATHTLAKGRCAPGLKTGNLKKNNRDHKKYLNKIKILVTCKFYYI